MVPGETPAQEAPGTGRHGTPSRLSAKRLSPQNGKSSRSDGCCEFHFRPVAVAARLLVVDAKVLRRVSRALLVGQQETSGSAVMGFAASCFHAWSLTSVELVQMVAAVATPCLTRTSLLRDRRVVPLFALPRCLTNWQSTGSAWGIILVGVSWRTWRMYGKVQLESLKVCCCVGRNEDEPDIYAARPAYVAGRGLRLSSGRQGYL